MKNAMQLKAVVKKIAKEKKISAQLVLQNYMLERFLERVSVSRFKDNFILKGGFLIASMVGLDSRATMDMDATMKGYPVTEETIQRMIVDPRPNGEWYWSVYEDGSLTERPMVEEWKCPYHNSRMCLRLMQ